MNESIPWHLEILILSAFNATMIKTRTSHSFERLSQRDECEGEDA